MGLFRRTKTVDIFFVGCEGTDIDRGIYSFFLDVTNGEIIKKMFVKSLSNPVSMAPSTRFVNITYRNGSGRNDDGGIWQYAMIEKQLGLTSRVDNVGKTYVDTLTVVNDDFQACYGVDYYNGEIVRVPMKNKKLLGRIVETIKLNGKSIDPIKQTESHPTCIVEAPDHRIIVTDMGGDEILVYTTGEKGKLIKDEDHSFHLEPGSGPKKLIFSKDRKHAYLINEISSKIHVYEYFEGEFTLVQELLSYLPEEFNGVNVPTDIDITNNNRFVIVTNKGDDTMVLFKIDEDGTIKRVDCMEVAQGPTCVKIFRDRWIVVISKTDGSIESFEIKEGERNGFLFETHSVYNLHNPVCMIIGQENLRVV